MQNGSLPASSSQRFLPLQHAATSPVVASNGPVAAPGRMPRSVVGSPTTAPVSASPIARPSAQAVGGSNVVSLHVVNDDAIFGPAPDDFEAEIRQAWDQPRQSVVGTPTTTAAARERRRHIVIGLGAGALITLLGAFAGIGWMIPLNVAFDAAFLGFIILLVRHRQMVIDRVQKVEPIRPPVSEQRPVAIQPAPAYLLRSGT